MNYNGYGMDNCLGAYSGQDTISYLDNDYGAYGDPVLTARTRTSNAAKTRELQQLLVSAGHLRSSDVDGDFSTGTRNAIRAFQGANNLEVTGTSTQETWDALRGGGVSEATRQRYGTDGGAASLARGLGLGLGLSSFQPSGEHSDVSSPGSTARTDQGGGGSTDESSGMPTWGWVAIGVGAVALIGTVVAVSRKGGK